MPYPRLDGGPTRVKGLKLAVRCDANPPGEMEVKMTTTQGDPVRYRLINVPLYLLWNLDKILAAYCGDTLERKNPAS